jgi:hypothetical protein
VVRVRSPPTKREGMPPPVLVQAPAPHRHALCAHAPLWVVVALVVLARPVKAPAAAKSQGSPRPDASAAYRRHRHMAPARLLQSVLLCPAKVVPAPHAATERDRQESTHFANC